MMRGRSGKINFVKIFLLLALGGGGSYAYAWGPHFWCRYKMDQVVQECLLTWRDRSLKKAEEQLPKAMDDHEIPQYVLVKDCQFYEDKGERHLRCEWTISVQFVPFLDYKQVRTFASHKYLTAGNELETME